MTRKEPRSGLRFGSPPKVKVVVGYVVDVKRVLLEPSNEQVVEAEEVRLEGPVTGRSSERDLCSSVRVGRKPR